MEFDSYLFDPYFEDIEKYSSKVYYEEIAQMIFKRVSEKRALNFDYVIDLIDFAIEWWGVEDYLNELPNRKNIMGIKYDSQDTQTIVPETIFEKNNSYTAYLEGYENDFYHYLHITYLVLKEIEYYKLFRNYQKEYGSTLKNTILQMSYFKYVEMLQNFSHVYPKKAKIQENQIFAQKKTFSLYRNLAPEERYTNIASYSDILEITQLLEQEKVNMVNKLDLCNIFLKPYAFIETCNRCNENNEDMLSPTLYYLDKLKYSKRKINRLVRQSEDLDANERLKLGLILAENELYKIRKSQNELERTLKMQ